MGCVKWKTKKCEQKLAVIVEEGLLSEKVSNREIMKVNGIQSLSTEFYQIEQVNWS